MCFCFFDRNVTVLQTLTLSTVTSFPTVSYFRELQRTPPASECVPHISTYLFWNRVQKGSAQRRSSSKMKWKWKHERKILTITAGKSVTPLMILFANDWLLIAQCVSWVTREWHTRANGKAASMATTIDRDTRIETRVWFHFHTWESHHRSANAAESKGWGYVCAWGDYTGKILLPARHLVCLNQTFISDNQPYFHIWCWNLLQSGCCLWWTTGTGRWTWKSGNEALGCRGIRRLEEKR